jgi:adenosylhomocysteinase
VWEDDLAAVARTRPQLVVDDGAELTVRIARDHPGVLAGLEGITEETTTGVARLRRLHETGRLPLPAIAANDAACKHLFDNRYGTGQSTIQAIAALTNLRLPGMRVVVVGYGWVGRGIATYVRALGGRVGVVEVDPIRALEAHTDGHDVTDLRGALPGAGLVITATGGVDAIADGHLPLLADRVVLANAGHHDREIDVRALEAAATDTTEVRPGVTRFRLEPAREVFLLSGGALVNIAGGLGHPIEIMDLSFSVQALGCHLLASTPPAAGVHDFPAGLDRQIAAAKLASRGIRLDTLTVAQGDTLRGLIDEDPEEKP